MTDSTINVTSNAAPTDSNAAQAAVPQGSTQAAQGNNDTTVYYVATDNKCYVKYVSPTPIPDGTRVEVPNASLNDFFTHMNLYRVYSNGKIDYPDFEAKTMGDQITALETLAQNQAGQIDTLISQNKSLQATINMLLIKGAK